VDIVQFPNSPTEISRALKWPTRLKCRVSALFIDASETLLADCDIIAVSAGVRGRHTPLTSDLHNDGLDLSESVGNLLVVREVYSAPLLVLWTDQDRPGRTKLVPTDWFEGYFSDICLWRWQIHIRSYCREFVGWKGFIPHYPKVNRKRLQSATRANYYIIEREGIVIDLEYKRLAQWKMLLGKEGRVQEMEYVSRSVASTLRSIYQDTGRRTMR
jgi:hypothetical protein